MTRYSICRTLSSVVIVLIILALSASPAFALSGGPDSFGYYFSDSNEPGGPAYNFEDIAATGTSLTLGDDQTSGAIPLGFSFDYYGTTYTDVYISSNGYLTFLSGQPTPWDSVGIPSAADPDAMVAGWWTDLDPRIGGTIHYQMLGSAPDRYFILQYTDMPHFSWIGGSLNPVTFQIKLFESSNVVEFHYEAAPDYADLNNSAGIENQDGSVGLQYYFGTGGLTTPLAVRYANGALPVAADDSGSDFETDEDTPLTFDVAANDTDADGNLAPTTTNTVCSGCSVPTNGSLTNHGDGTFTYTPDANYFGADSFTYQICDATSLCDTAVVSLTVNPVNDAPMADGQNLVTDEDTPLAVTLTGSDVDGDSLAFAVMTPPAHGTLTGTAPDLAYTPDVDYHGADSFTFRAHDGTVASPEATVEITVNPVNDAPVADNQNLSTNENTSLAVTLTGSDVDGDSLTFTVGTPPAHGTLTGTAPDLTYTPDTDYHGADSFTFVANDGTVNSAEAAVSIYVNTPPVADPQSLATDEDTPLVVTLTGSDADGDSLAFAVMTPPAHGTLTGTAPDLTYTPDADYHGADSFTFRTHDGTVASPEATVEITVNPVNDAPVADAQSLATDEDTPLALTLTGSDIDGDSLTLSVVTPPAHGTLTGASPDLTYTPDADYHGADSFTFAANDGTASSTEATVDLTVNPVNDAPVANSQSLATDEDTLLAVTLTGSDVDGDSLTFAVVTPPAHGTLTGSAPDLTYTPAADYHGADSFTFTVNDGSVDSAAGTITIDVNSINDAPVVEAGPDQTADEGDEVNFQGTFVDAGLRAPLDGETLEWDFGDGATADGTLTPSHTYADDGVYVVTLTVTDAEGGVDSDSLVVTVLNRAPVLVEDVFELELPVGQLAVIEGSFTDPGWLDEHTVEITWEPGMTESLELAAGEDFFTFDITFMKPGVYPVTVTITDGDGGSTSQVYTVTVTGSVLYLPTMRK